MLLLALVVASAASAATDGECAAAPEGSKYAHNPPCYFPTEFLEVPVKAVRQETHNSKVITFALPEGTSLSLPVSSAILMKAVGAGEGGKDVIKPYNPISSNSVLGSFDLLIKGYEGGAASQWAMALQPGDRVAFKQVKGNIKPFLYPFPKVERITMLAGGTGIAPMIQALHAILETTGDTIKVRILYSNKSPADIMLKATLDDLKYEYAARLKVTYIVGEDEDDDRAVANDGWEGETGWIDEEKIRRLAFPPAPGTVVWVCGVDDFYVALAGSRMKPLTEDSVLRKLGYTEEMVWRS